MAWWQQGGPSGPAGRWALSAEENASSEPSVRFIHWKIVRQILELTTIFSPPNEKRLAHDQPAFYRLPSRNIFKVSIILLRLGSLDSWKRDFPAIRLKKDKPEGLPLSQIYCEGLGGLSVTFGRPKAQGVKLRAVRVTSGIYGDSEAQITSYTGLKNI
ncbi:hypothetical protein BDN72DRAFT_864817 [Pluteus cervinus]|uniref:Uncharacterized protein n=1 Tax=Pluteus cervinus TaxID=181527 RepID=A0ACD3A207_9AGAR|nr:hypothetical protein BDN72DRAFT_864817 [Pluteus cervinus]